MESSVNPEQYPEYSNEELQKMPFMNPDLDVEERVNDLLSRLTLREKCLLSAGESNNAPPAIPRLGIRQFSMTDGPHGVSPYKTGVGPNGVKIPESQAGASTYFPTGIQLASTWNPPLLEKFGEALAEETRAVGRYMQLGPAMNICRNPMNGRTFEYYSEDPLLSGECGSSAVKGIQKVRIAPCVKHYVANNFESNRFKVNVKISERALREIYLSGFKRVVEKSDPWGIMSAYNKINGTYVSEHKKILREILKDEWGFSGVVVSDWGATNHTSGIIGLVEAGLDIEMGSRNKYDVEEMIALYEQGKLNKKLFDDNIKRILRAMIRTGLFDPPEKLPEGKLNTPEHQQISKELAEEGMILLKNENNLLPIDINKIKKIAILGKHADLKFGRKKLGGGSSAVYPPYEITVREGIKRKCGDKIEIVEDPSEADVAIVCVGLEHTHDFKGGDHEGSDRLRYSLGITQPKLINKTVAKNPNTIVICINGQPFGMEKFVNNVPAILEAWYGGMEIGTVVAEIIFGDINPSGKLPLSWPKYKKDIPTAMSLWTTIIGPKEVDYTEDIYVGYRYYEKYNTELRFPFGYGLSYTTFEYSNLQLPQNPLEFDDNIEVKFTLKNSGKMDGKEIAQVYIAWPQNIPDRPVKELKGFGKYNLKTGESLDIAINIPVKDLQIIDPETEEWVLATGAYKVLVGSSIKDIKLEGTIQIK